MKKNKIPKIFRKKYTQKTLNKKILKRIHIPKEREMVKRLFKENSDGKMEIIQEVPKDVLLQLKSLAKSIKKNKGMVSRWKGFVLLFIIALILVFNLFFKDKLVTKGIETGLESVFQAKAEVKGLHLSLIKGTFSYQSLSIADSGNSSLNLLETGPSAFRVNIPELLSKRIRIEEMSLTGFRVNTPREVDGALPVSSLDEQKVNEDKIAETLDFLSIGNDDIDFKALLQEQKDNLISLNLINKGNEEIDAATNKWEDTYAQKNKEIGILSEKVASLKSISIENIGSIAEGQQALQQITDVYDRVTETKTDLVLLQEEFTADRKRLAEMNKLVKNAVDEDLSYLNSMINFSTGGGRSLASSAAEKYIRNRWNNYYEYGLKALEVYERIQDRKQENLKEKKVFHRNEGRLFIFPGSNNPGFLIEHILISGGDDNSGTLLTEIKSVSSEPDKLSEPLIAIVCTSPPAIVAPSGKRAWKS